MIETIAPGGFENYFHELAPLMSPNVPPDMNAIFALSQRYGLEFAMDSLPELTEKYGVKLL